MIELTFNTLFILYLGVTVLMILGTWIYSHYRVKKRVFFTLEKALFVCEFCHYSYLEEEAKQLNRCPQCGLYNKENTFEKSKRLSEKSPHERTGV